MANSEEETIIANGLLTCGVCLEPRALPGHRGFCRECLVKISSKDIICDNCDTTIPNQATVRCIDCKQHLCDTCNALHGGLKTFLTTMMNHRVISMENIHSWKADLEDEENTIGEHNIDPNNCYYKDESRAISKDSVVLKTCQTEPRINIDGAAQEKYEELAGLVRTNDKILKMYKDSIKEVGVIEKELEINTQVAKTALAKVKEEYIKVVNQTVERFEDEIDKIKEERMKELERMKIDLRSTLQDIETTADSVRHVIMGSHKMEAMSNHSTLSAKLKTLSTSQPDKVDKTLGYVKFEAAIPSILNIGRVLKEETTGNMWNLVGQFDTNAFNALHGLALDEDHNIVVCSWDKGVKVFTRNGDVESTIYDSSGAVDVARLPGKKNVSVPVNIHEIKIFDSHGKQAKTFPITDVNDEASTANSLAVDSNNKIIVGQVEYTISIHNSDGSEIYKFATESMPFRLAVTSHGDIVCSFFDDELECGTSLQLLDYGGGNEREIKPPREVKVWSPGFVCCGQGEIFVCNGGSGVPRGVFRYTSEGDYLGCVTTQVIDPAGIALSRDGMELFVADYGDSHVKIYRRA